MTNVVRRILGTVAAILLGAGALLLFRWIASPPPGSYQLEVLLGETGQNLSSGSDVKMRDVRIGTVGQIVLDDQARAVATVTILGPRRVPADVEVSVDAKTVLGEKFVQLTPSGPLDRGPFLADGDRLAVGEEQRDVPEVQDLLDALDPILAALDPTDVGTLIDEFGAFTPDDARLAARNFELGAELSAFGARTADEQIARISSLATLTGELARTAPDFNRLNRTLPRWVSFLPDRQPAVRTNLEALSSFALTAAEFFEVEEETIGDLLTFTTIVQGVLAEKNDEVASIIHGISRYAFKLSRHGGNLNDGTEFGYFRVFIGGEGEIERLCAGLPPEFRQHAPGCLEDSDTEQEDEGGDTPEQDPEDEPSDGRSEDAPEDEPRDDEDDEDDGGQPLPLPTGGTP